jgi:hypothetical protein
VALHRDLRATFAPRVVHVREQLPRADKASCGHAEPWNAFKRVTAGSAPDERAAPFHGAAAWIYRRSLAP